MKIFELCHSTSDGDERRFFSHENKTEAEFNVDVLKGLNYIATLTRYYDRRKYIGTDFFYARLLGFLTSLGYEEVSFINHTIQGMPIIEEPIETDHEQVESFHQVKGWMEDDELDRILMHNKNVLTELNKENNDSAVS